MEWFCKAMDWVFGVKWDREGAKENMKKMIQREEDNASVLSNMAYQEAMRCISEVPSGDNVAATQIADELLVKLASIQMDKKSSIKIIQEEFENLDKKMTPISRNFVHRWFHGIG